MILQRAALTRILAGVEHRARFPRDTVHALGRAGFLSLGGEQAEEVVDRFAPVCPATAAVLRSHYAAVALIGADGGAWLQAEIAAGRHLSTVALTDDPADPARSAESGGVVRLSGRKLDVVAAGEADSYVWSARGADGEPGLWLVPAQARGLLVPAVPDGSGPAGCAGSSVRADPVLLPASVSLRTLSAV
ncbi:acyl-CoA dehydrogenase [Streptacidiphilus sp. N1-3]|uniref:Acyl-CoA dehydrogenase n=1 Tax=Streptacidiphilus alkalitolerans TaxID=3342712 RepID=A0ABV6XAD1_9ACTN